MHEANRQRPKLGILCGALHYSYIIVSLIFRQLLFFFSLPVQELLRKLNGQLSGLRSSTAKSLRKHLKLSFETVRKQGRQEKFKSSLENVTIVTFSHVVIFTTYYYV